jgi:hypothetical protein
MNCSTVLKGLSAFDCRSGNELTRISGFFLTTDDFVVDTLAHVGTKSYFTAGQIAGTVFHVPKIKSFENKSVEAKYKEFDDMSRKKTQNSRRGARTGFDLTLDDHKIISSYSGKFSRIIPYDANGNMGMTSEDGLTNFRGLSLSYLETENQPYATADEPALTFVEWQESEANEWNEQGYTVQPYKGTAATRWYPSSLTTITYVSIVQVGTIATNAFVVEVNFKSLSDIDNTGAYAIINGITGALAANFETKNGSGVIVTPSGVVAGTGSQTNRYTLTFETFTAGTTQVIPTIALMVKSDVLTLA